MLFRVVILMSALWTTAFIVAPNAIGALLPPFLLLLSWPATLGPFFVRSPRHADINAVLGTRIMHHALVRSFWTPRKLNGAWRGILVVVMIAPGVVLGFWPVLFGTASEVSLADVIWWTVITPPMLCAASFAFEAVVKQTIAMPIVGLPIIACFIGLPLMAGQTGPPWTDRSRYAMSATLAVLPLLSLWTVDMLRLMNPRSERLKRLPALQRSPASSLPSPSISSGGREPT